MTTDTPSDLVKRPRALFIMDEANSDNPLGQEAADLIEKFERERDEAREQLRWETLTRIAAETELAEARTLLRWR